MSACGVISRDIIIFWRFSRSCAEFLGFLKNYGQHKRHNFGISCICNSMRLFHAWQIFNHKFFEISLLECLRGSRPSQIFKYLTEACGDSVLSRSRVFEWARRFSEGRTSIEDDQRYGRPVTKTNHDHVERVRKQISEDARIMHMRFIRRISRHQPRHYTYHIITGVLAPRTP